MKISELNKKDNEMVCNVPLEPYIVVKEEIEGFTNYRATEKDGVIYIPVANYDENNSRDHYTTIAELKEWLEAYNMEVFFIGIFAKNFMEDID